MLAERQSVGHVQQPEGVRAHVGVFDPSDHADRPIPKSVPMAGSTGAGRTGVQEFATVSGRHDDQGGDDSMRVFVMTMPSSINLRVSA
ncbi:hypothetical protein GCM10022248_43130 [Nonomuraea soli]